MQRKTLGIVILTLILISGISAWTNLTNNPKQSGDQLFSSEWNVMQENIEILYSKMITYASILRHGPQNASVGGTLTAEMWNNTQENIEYLSGALQQTVVMEVYGDENATTIAACNEWVKQAVGSKGGGYENWIWVPARHANAGSVAVGNGSDYRKPVEYNGVNYICRGFAVAKYEMTYADATSPNSTGGGTDWNTYAYNSGKTAVSMPDRYPIADITQSQAITACQGIGSSFHLITNDEYMTIARNIEQQASNWSGNAVGNGYISNGLTNDAIHGCGAGNSKSIYETLYGTLPKDRATKTGIGTGIGTNTSCDTKRQLKLSNNSIIWDLAGNVWEHVNKANTINGTGYDTGQTSIAGIGCESVAGRATETNGCWALSSYRGTYGPATAGGADQGFGNVYYPQGVANNIFHRGGGALNGAATGLFVVDFSWAASNQNRGGGFRCSL